VEKEVERPKIREFVALDCSLAESREVPPDSIGRDLPSKQRVESFLSRDQTDIDRIPFIARPGVSDV